MAVAPKKVTQGVSCSQLSDATNEDLYTEGFKWNFERDINYAEVYKNFNTDTLYKVWIDRSELDDKLEGVTKMTSYPYDTIQFQPGDYITWNDTNFLLVTLQDLRSYEVVGDIQKCTQSLNRYDKNGILSQVLAPFYSIKGGGKSEDKDFSTSTGKRYADVPRNEAV